MKIEEILSKCDHTLLAQTATWEEIKAICDDGIKYHTASVCIPASYVKQAKNYVGGLLPICTVIGFPNGYDTTAAKCFMAADAVENFLAVGGVVGGNHVNGAVLDARNQRLPVFGAAQGGIHFEAPVLLQIAVIHN